MKQLVLIVAVACGLLSSSMRAQDMYGTWRGVWTVQEKFILNNVLQGTPPFEPVDLQLTVEPYNASLMNYGNVGFGGGTPGEYLIAGKVSELISLSAHVAVDFRRISASGQSFSIVRRIDAQQFEHLTLSV